MNSLQRQRGMGLLNLILIILVISFLANFAFKVVPLYAENRYVETGLRDLVAPGSKLEQMSDNEINKRMNDFYLINAVRSTGPQKIVIDRKVDQVIVKIDYETRTPFLYNIDLIVSFKNHLDSSRPGECCKPFGEK